jgi:tetratricopeptide (TPR) repeat protein
MTKIPVEMLPDQYSSRRVNVTRPVRRFWCGISAALVVASLWANPAFAKDPFRTKDARPISDNTEAAFKAIFEKGDYKTASTYLQKVEANEPLANALQASMAYINWEGAKGEQKAALASQFRSSAQQTRTSAEQLLKSDPLRGNLYIAVSHFLEGAYAIGTEGTVRGTPQALGRLQEAFKHLDEAEKIAPQDPELNLIKGYMDLLLSINLPFSNPNDAIGRLERHAGPRYLADRGLALGYRDMNQQAKALEAIDRAINATPVTRKNPELLYLKAQILVRKGDNRGSIPLFEEALKSQDQLPPGLVKQISRELDKSRRRLANVKQ